MLTAIGVNSNYLSVFGKILKGGISSVRREIIAKIDEFKVIY